MPGAGQPPEQFARPQAAPGGPAGVPTDQTIGMSQDEMKGNLQGMLSQLLSKYSDYKAKHAAIGAGLAEQKGNMLSDLFDFFKSIGVDPNQPEEISAYLEMLGEQSPELRAQLEKLLQRALGDVGEEDALPPEGMEPEVPVEGDAQQGGMPPAGQGMLG